ncbi:MAG: DUF4013 domain-containing protein [Chloroflexi bacterium]|jgi:hypothetical protein|nr:DUF4013 domain-containing protein [Chloroflexota bacterium]
MDYGKSLTFVFEDERWISKFAVGVLVTLVPIINFATYGYMVQLLKNVRDGHEYPLPEWDDFGKFFVDGLKFLAGFLVYMVPVILLSFFIIPIAIAAESGGGTGDALAVAMMCISCLVILLSFLPMLLYPALYIQYAKEDQISDMFRFAEMWELFKADSANYLIILLMIFFVLAFIASFGMLLCFVGVFLTAWWAQLAAAHMIGQLAQPQEKPATF